MFAESCTNEINSDESFSDIDEPVLLNMAVTYPNIIGTPPIKLKNNDMNEINIARFASRVTENAQSIFHYRYSHCS